MSNRFRTHEVSNTVPEFPAVDLLALDAPLCGALAAHGADPTHPGLRAYAGQVAGELAQAGRLANRHRPELRAFDASGHRIDRVDFHPAYHRLMGAAIEAGVTSLAWTGGGPADVLHRAALMYLHYQADPGTCCPLTMSHCAVPTLRLEPRLAERWLPKLWSCHYDPRHVPVAGKCGVTVGMGMTEKQGGSDVRANTTVAHADGHEDGLDRYRLVGHKWFLSAPMSDAFLVLAQLPEGPSCFLLPRLLDDGRNNAWHIQRLKDKLGDWSNASAEVEFCDALAWRVGEPGRGVAAILRMVALTRLDCQLGSAGLMRRALLQALHHARHRRAFGRRLIDQPLMRTVLADLALEVEACTALAFRVASAVAAGDDGDEAVLARLGTGIGKAYICKRAVAVANEAQECLGGAGYVEESLLPGLYRQAPLNAIWEGSGNIQALDLKRALAREERAAVLLDRELAPARGLSAAADRALAGALEAVQRPAELPEARARWLAEQLALLWAAALLTRREPALGRAFVEARIGTAATQFGATSAALPEDLLLARALSGG